MQGREVSTDAGIVALRKLLEERIMMQHQTFYNEMRVIIELEFVKAHNEIMEGKITNNIMKERSMYYVNQKVPKELYEIATGAQSDIEGKIIAMNYVNQALGDIVRLYVDSVMKEHQRMWHE